MRKGRRMHARTAGMENDEREEITLAVVIVRLI